MTLPWPPLLVISDRRQARSGLEDVARAAFAGGCRWFSVREKDLPAAERMDLVRRIASIGREWGAVVGVHDDVAAALALDCALHLPAAERTDLVRRIASIGREWGAVVGVHDDVAAALALDCALHLPAGAAAAASGRLERDDIAFAQPSRSNSLSDRVIQTSGDPASGHHARSDRVIQTSGDPASGHHALVGRSAHAGDDLSAAATAGLDYATLSPVFVSASKPEYGPALGLNGLAAVVRGAAVPVIALGGIDGPDAVRGCLGSGAAGVAVMGGVMRAEDAGSVVRALIQAFDQVS